MRSRDWVSYDGVARDQTSKQLGDIGHTAFVDGFRRDDRDSILGFS